MVWYIQSKFYMVKDVDGVGRKRGYKTSIDLSEIKCVN